MEKKITEQCYQNSSALPIANQNNAAPHVAVSYLWLENGGYILTKYLNVFFFL